MNQDNNNPETQTEVLTLWLVIASGYDKRKAHMMTFTYAKDEDQAREDVKEWLAQYQDRPIHTFKRCNNGFNFGWRMWQPGQVEVTKPSSRLP